jgi:hypothetical protein
MKSGAHGASNSGPIPGPVRKPRTVERSRNAWLPREVSALNDDCNALASTAGPSRPSSQCPTWASTWLRMLSMTLSTANANTVIRLSMIKVSVLCADKTRS